MSYKNKKVWITGASSGIGEAYATAFFKDGAKLILSSRRKEELERVRQNLGATDDQVKIVTLDLADSNSLPQKADEALAAFGGLDVLVNNGGISQRSLFAETDMETIRKLMEVNFFGSAILTRAVLPTMIEKNSGQIIVTSSVAGKIGTQYRSAYAASKHAINGLFDAIRQEVYEHNISVTVVCPGPIKTNIGINAVTSDGSKFGKVGDLHENAMEPDEMVAKIWSKIKAGKEEIIISTWREKVGLLLKRISPVLLNKVLRKSNRIKE